jgi:hypothetical protein
MKQTSTLKHSASLSSALSRLNCSAAGLIAMETPRFHVKMPDRRLPTCPNSTVCLMLQRPQGWSRTCGRRSVPNPGRRLPETLGRSKNRLTSGLNGDPGTTQWSRRQPRSSADVNISVSSRFGEYDSIELQVPDPYHVFEHQIGLRFRRFDWRLYLSCRFVACF